MSTSGYHIVTWYSDGKTIGGKHGEVHWSGEQLEGDVEEVVYQGLLSVAFV